MAGPFAKLIPQARAATTQEPPKVYSEAPPSPQVMDQIGVAPARQDSEDLVAYAIRVLAGRCDGAVQQDGVGFNMADAYRGRKLADTLDDGRRLTQDELAWAAEAIPKYFKNQLPQITMADWKRAVRERESQTRVSRNDWEPLPDLALKIAMAGVDADTIPPQRRAFWLSLRKVNHWTERQRYWAIQLLLDYGPESLPEAEPEPAAPAEPTPTPSLPAPRKSLFAAAISQTRKDTPNAPSNRSDQSAPQIGSGTGEEASARPEAGEAQSGTRGAAPEESTGVEARLTPVEAPAAPRKVLFGKLVQQVVQAKATHAEPLEAAAEANARTAGVMLPEVENLPDVTQALIESSPPAREGITWEKLDPSQRAAIEGMLEQQYACLTGAAGTGKTTCERLFLERLGSSLSVIDLNRARAGARWKRPEVAKDNESDDDSDIEAEDRREFRARAMAICAFTGRAVQQAMKNFDDSWRKHCMTIHRLLGFYPEYYDALDDKTGMPTAKLQFVPFYTEENKLPYEVIVIDEAGMLGIQLWNQLFAACRPGTRIYMIGDINQLPPVMGRSVFGYALQSWPSFELTEIHRQVGDDNPIVLNAWKILQGRNPSPVDRKFDVLTLPDDATLARRTVLAAVKKLNSVGQFDPWRDAIITPLNGYDTNKPSSIMGQAPLNEALVFHFNPPPELGSTQIEGRRTLITAGFHKVLFGIGDKVMVTKNDADRQLTNGMVGRIVDITMNGNYNGDTQIEEMSAVDLDKFLNEEFELRAQTENASTKEKEKEEASQRAASHIVTVNFGTTMDGKEIIEPFASAGQVNSLMLAYAITCHKSQGGQYRNVVVVVHHRSMARMTREWLYTAVTRAEERVILLCSKTGLLRSLNNQAIKGKNLAEKAQHFLALSEAGSDEHLDLPPPRPMARKE